MKQSWVVVTGAGSGLGKAIALAFASQGHSVLGIGRRLPPLQQLQASYPQQIAILSADVGHPQGRSDIQAAIPNGDAVQYLVHNAGVLQPIKPLLDVTPEEFREHVAINLEGPLFLTQSLSGYLQDGSRILNISSGAAQSAYKGWGTYCTSKAALHMVYKTLDLELKGKGIRVGSVRPGVVDTPMQDTVRTADAKDFPALQKFIDLKQNNQLLPPEKVASFIQWLLTETSADEFAASEWDIRGESHQGKW